jgi:methionyl-tRNA synthetase
LSRFFLTTAIDFVNAAPHMGHAYEKITADVIARYKRLSGVATHFLIGNDEHSQNVYRRARELGLDPLVYCDQMEQVFRQAYARLHISYDDFIRTTQPRHAVAVQAMVRKIADAGDIFEGEYEGWYCVSCEAFKQEKDLVDGLCPIHKVPPQWIKERNHFFRLSRYREPLLRHIDANPSFVEPEIRRNEVVRWLEGDLEDLSISRAGQAWGIPMPDDPSSVIYVWFDALINYISAVGYGSDEQLLSSWWPANLHVIGKDITRFHCIVWPAMLMSAGAALPERVFGHGFVTYRGERMSKSLGTVVDPLEVVEKRGLDPLRLYLIKEAPYGGDIDFAWERFDERYNADLANNLGNLVSRIASMAERYRAGRLVSVGAPGRLSAIAADTVKVYRAAMDGFDLHEGAVSAYRLITSANEFIAETEPWALARRPESADRLSQVLFDVAEAVRVVGVLLLPVMPASAAEVLRRVGETRETASLRLDTDARWRQEGERALVKADPLWPRLNGDKPAAGATPIPPITAAKQRDQSPMSNTPDVPTPSPQADGDPTGPSSTTVPAIQTAAPATDDRLSMDEFMKIDLRVARVLAAERVPKSKKLVKLTVDVGAEQRTLVAGIAEAYEPDTLVGRSVVIVANLKPATLMGIESNGMVLAGSPEGGKPELVGFDTPPPPGSRVR